MINVPRNLIPERTCIFQGKHEISVDVGSVVLGKLVHGKLDAQTVLVKNFLGVGLVVRNGGWVSYGDVGEEGRRHALLWGLSLIEFILQNGNGWVNMGFFCSSITFSEAEVLIFG